LIANITCSDMHTGGEPVRIVTSGYPDIPGDTILDKRIYARNHLDHLRKMLIYEPRGHADMYGVLLVKPDHVDADIAVLFMHNEGYSTMCGHAIIALGRFAIDQRLVPIVEPETLIKIQCPCGLINTYVSVVNGKPSEVRFTSVPAFAYIVEKPIMTDSFGLVNVDIAYGGAFYAVTTTNELGLCINSSKTQNLVDAATDISAAVRTQVSLEHPEQPDLGFLYGTIFTDGKDTFSSQPTKNICIFANSQVDRSPTGSGVTARIALQHKKGQISIGQSRVFQSVTGSTFSGKAISQTSCGALKAVIVEVSGKSYYTSRSHFTLEKEDEMGRGFLLR